MKKKVATKSVKKISKTQPAKSRAWIFVLGAFLIGGMVGYATHYMIANWNYLFSETLKCDDGNKPDKNGCCAGEVYTDAGGGWMVCCPDGGDNCFPPLK